MKIAIRGLLVGLILLMLASSDLVSSAAPAATRVLTLGDRQGRTALSIEVANGSADLGQFAFRVVGRGSFVAIDHATVELKGDHELKVRYLGAFAFFRESDTGAAPERVSGRLEAEIQPDTHRGEAELIVTGPSGTPEEHFALQTPELQRDGAVATARAFESAALAGDWQAVYLLLSSTVRGGFSADTFASSVAGQIGTVGKLVGLRRGTASDVTSTDSGVAFVVIPYVATYASPSGQVVRQFNAYFTFEEGSWRLWFTEER